MRTTSVEFQSPSLRVLGGRCRAPVHDCGEIEYCQAHTLVLPQAGIFLKYEQRHVPLVGDAAHGVFFTADRPYRVSHPAPQGDAYLEIEYAPDALLRVLEDLDPDAAERPTSPFRMGGVRLGANAILTRRVLWHRLRRRLASSLEIEEAALTLFAAAVAASRHPGAASPAGRRETPRVAELVRATQVTIAQQPSAPWSLATLATRVQCSPFYLARRFRHCLGVSIHQYQLHARLVEALDQILDSTRGLSAIALDAGFAHHSHFTDAFRRWFGLTPSELRRRATTSRVTELRRGWIGTPRA